ncbi:C40 family peptidase [Isoptericola sp. NPDC057391]|uniref:C40 family peptidase n=1 Tax=Isoptericola sp. NPDC057391 TaxID=3346117 RepID=UPI00362DF725
MSMTQALSRVGEIRTQIATLQELGAPSATSTTGASTGATTGSSTGASTTARAADFATALQTAAGAGPTSAPGGLAQTLTSLLPALSGASSGTTTAGGAGTAAAGAAPRAEAPRPAGTPSGTGDAVVETAKKYLGTPYVWGGESLAEGGLDCSGLVYLSYSQHGVKLPRVARDMMREGTEIPSLAEARPGDLVIQRGGRHVGLYLGDGQMIHSPQPGRTVEIASITDDRVTTIRRVVD